ncbi:MAG: shikimate kinase [Verrucomicrobiales bacterium]|nr:shikimate kinase [Verrucomicrobiales bacterium]
MSTAATRPLNVILIGFMGCGKTTVGNLLARQLGFQFLDTDQLIVKKAKRPIPVIFEQEGEAGFRALESAILDDLTDCDRSVIATGGGIVTVPENVPKLRQLGLVIWLNPPEDVLYQRIIRNHDRPLVRTENPRQTVHDLLTIRRPLYSNAAHLDVDVSDVTPDEAAYGLAESVRVFFTAPLSPCDTGS